MKKVNSGSTKPKVKNVATTRKSPKMSELTPGILAAAAKPEVETEAKISGFGIKYADRGIIRPTLDKNYYVLADNQQMAEVVVKMSEKEPQNLMLTGPQGTGKTEFAMWLAAKFDRPLFIMNCATVRETKDWFGYRDAKAGSILWHKSEFVRACQIGKCIVLLDEFNRLHTTVHNSLYPLLDARRSSFLEELEEVVQVAPETVFVATANIGFNHTGTHTLDSAIEDRFGFRIDLDFPAVGKEAEILVNKVKVNKALADKLARFGRDIRKKAKGAEATLQRPVSVRQILQTAMVMKEFEARGIDIKKAIDYTILPFYSKENGTESEQAQILQLVQGIFA